jgi:hypothetical protein
VFLFIKKEQLSWRTSRLGGEIGLSLCKFWTEGASIGEDDVCSFLQTWDRLLTHQYPGVKYNRWEAGDRQGTPSDMGWIPGKADRVTGLWCAGAPKIVQRWGVKRANRPGAKNCVRFLQKKLPCLRTLRLHGMS